MSSRDFLFDVDLLDRRPTDWASRSSRCRPCGSTRPARSCGAGREASRMLKSALRLWIHHRTMPVERRRLLGAAAPSRPTDAARSGRCRCGLTSPSSPPTRRPVSDTAATAASPRTRPTWPTALAATGLDVDGRRARARRRSGASSSTAPIAVRRAFRSGRRALPGAVRRGRGAGARVVHLQFELFLYGGSAVARRSGAGARRARRTLGDAPLVTTMHQVVEPSTIDRDYTRLHRVGAPAIVARGGIAGVQAAITRAGAATIVHEEPFRRVLPAATVIPHGIEVAGPDGPRRGPPDARPRTTASSCCASGSSPRTRASSSCSKRPARRAARRGRRRRRRAPADAGPTAGSAPSCATRYGDAARFTGWVPDGDVGALVRRRRPAPCSRTPSRSPRAGCWPSPSPTARRCCCRRPWPAAPARRASLTAR